MDLIILRDITIIFGVAVVVILVCQRLKIPPIIGYLLTGVLAGPHGFSLISGIHEVEILAEIGVILLLFTIGIEFSLKNLVKIRNTLMIGGGLQVFLTIAVFYLITRMDFVGAQDGNSIPESIFLGFLMTLSSTAIVLKLLQERGEFVSPHGRTILGVLIFQDIVIVPMILVLPFLAGVSDDGSSGIFEIALKVLAVVLMVFIGAKYVVPRLLYLVARTKSRELFLLTIIVIALAVAYLTYMAGLSLALGAFLAGLIVSESDYSQQAFGNVVPFLDVFTSFFFVSIGMMLDVDFLLSKPLLILLITIGVIVVKSVIATGAGLALGFPLRPSLLVGFTLAQVGEFSFILSKKGQELGLISEGNYQLFLDVSVLTMAATPFVMSAAPKFADILLRLPLPLKLKAGLSPDNVAEDYIKGINGHLIIIGYGVNGRNVARAAKFAKIPYEVIDLNAETVRVEKKKGEPIFFGDATQESVLEHASIKEAMVLVITLPGSADLRRITQVARMMNPHLHIIIRSRFVTDMQDLFKLGADEVVPEEFETSVEIFTRVLAKYLIPREEIEKLVSIVRADGYEMFRSLSLDQSNFGELTFKVPEININSLHVCKDSVIEGKSLDEIAFEKNHNLTLLALSRLNKTYSKMPDDFVLQENDILFFLASYDKLNKIDNLFKSGNSDCSLADNDKRLL
ncbi:MAG: cation:proton antiporter [Bacteroidales bacterium]|nr:cation:proton antiporter [Bacteroidales bacterium]